MSWTPLSSEMQIIMAALRVRDEIQRITKYVAPVVGTLSIHSAGGRYPGSLHSLFIQH